TTGSAKYPNVLVEAYVCALRRGLLGALRRALMHAHAGVQTTGIATSSPGFVAAPSPDGPTPRAIE
ncbi:hypothetical protein ACTGYF_11065, partial [Streptococcus suis]